MKQQTQLRLCVRISCLNGAKIFSHTVWCSTPRQNSRLYLKCPEDVSFYEYLIKLEMQRDYLQFKSAHICCNRCCNRSVKKNALNGLKSERNALIIRRKSNKSDCHFYINLRGCEIIYPYVPKRKTHGKRGTFHYFGQVAGFEVTNDA